MKRIKLGHICDIVSGSTPKTDIVEYWDGEFDWITPAELTEDTYIINESQRKITNIGVQKTGLKSFPKGTVILSSRAPIGKVAIAGKEMYCNQGFKNLICSDKIDNRYLYWYLKSNTDYLNSLGRGATFKELSKSIVENIEIPLPDLNIQINCANMLDKCWNLILMKKKQIKAYEFLIKSRFIEMFGNITEKVALKECCTLHARIGWQALTKKEHQKTGDYMLVTGTDFINGKINFSNCVYVSKNRYDMDKNIQIKNDDILITKDGTIGKVAIVEKLPMPATLNTGIFVVRPDKRFNKEYISYVFKGPLFEQFVNQVKTGSTIKHLNQGRLVKFEIPLPDMDMQNEFAKLYMQIGKSESAVKASLEKLETLKKSLMQQYFG